MHSLHSRIYLKQLTKGIKKIHNILTYNKLTKYCFLVAYMLFFISHARFFSTQPRCCLTFSWIELQMLLRCCLIHISINILRHFFIQTVFVSVSRPRSTFALSMKSIFHFPLNCHKNLSCNLMNKYTFGFLLIFRICPSIFGW